MSDANRVRLAYVEETSFGVLPGSPSTKALRYTGESLVSSRETTESQEIRDDRQIADLIEVGIGAGGGIDVELSQGAFDDLIIAALQAAAWSAVVDESDDDVSISAVDNSVNSPKVALDSYTAGQWVRLSGFVNDANNGYAKIVSAAANKLVLSNITLTTEAAPAAGRIVQGAYIENGTTRRSFAIERGLLDKGKYELFAGMNVGTWGLNFQTRQILTGSFGFTGKTATFGSSSIDGTPTPAPTKQVNNAVRHVKLVAVDGVPLTLLRQVSMNLNNNLRANDAIGQLGAYEVGSGRIGLTGSIEAYFEDGAVYQKALNNDPSSLAFALEDGAGNGQVVEMPRLKFSNPRANAQGVDQDVISQLDYTAYRHETELKTIRYARFPAA